MVSVRGNLVCVHWFINSIFIFTYIEGSGSSLCAFVHVCACVCVHVSDFKLRYGDFWDIRLHLGRVRINTGPLSREDWTKITVKTRNTNSNFHYIPHIFRNNVPLCCMNTISSQRMLTKSQQMLTKNQHMLQVDEKDIFLVVW